MGPGERVIVIIVSLLVIATSAMLFTLGLYFLQNRKQTQQFFLKPFSEQMKSLTFFRGVPVFGELYYMVFSWYTRTFPVAETATVQNDPWMRPEHEKPSWMNPQTAPYFVWLATGAILLYSLIALIVGIVGLYLIMTLS